MSASLMHAPLQLAPSILTEEQLLALARTYDTAGKPVWVHDLSAQCLYQNPASEGRTGLHGRLAVFDVIGPDGRRIAQLTTELD